MSQSTSISPSKIRRFLTKYYEAGEAAALTRIVCTEVMGQSQIDYFLGKDIELSVKEEEKISSILERLSHFEPIQHIQGFSLFCGRRFIVTPNVLIPRPETEELAQLVVSTTMPGCSLLDIGTGSGCLAVTLALDIPNAKVYAWDISPEALEIAQRNAEVLQAKVSFFQCDVLQYKPLASDRFDVIVSNPPYVLERERDAMEPNVLRWEPHLALFVPDNDPLLFYRRIGTLGREMLHPNGRLFFEINYSQGSSVKDLLMEQGYAEVEVKQDFYGNDRFVIAINNPLR